MDINQNQVYPSIAQMSQQTHQEHKGSMATFVSLLAQLSIDYNPDNELEALLSSLSYYGAADEQCQMVLDTINELNARFEEYKQANN